LVTISSNENQQIWEERVSEQGSSGLTQQQWCEENNINLHNFRYWKRRLSIIHQEASISQRFVAISPISTQARTPLQISMGKLAVEIREGVDLSLLDDVIKVLMRYA
jgi:hypothetical protein